MNIKQIFLSGIVDPQPISNDILHGPVTPELLRELAARNEAKRQQSIEWLGPKWLLHPSNKQRKINVSI